MINRQSGNGAAVRPGILILQIWAFLYREYCLTRRYWSWVVVFTFHAVINAAAVAIIGISVHDKNLTSTLTSGVLLWSFLSILFSQIASAIAYEGTEGTLEYTLMAPVPRPVHLLSICCFAAIYSAIRMVVVMGGLFVFLKVGLPECLTAVILLVACSGFAFIGFALLAATLPLVSPQRGREASNLIQSLLLLVSGIYYPISALPTWIQPFSVLSPATYALRAGRKLLGLEGAVIGVKTIASELYILTAIGIVFTPIGLLTFRCVENWAKRTGRVKMR